MRTLRFLPFLTRPILTEDFSVSVLRRPYLRTVRGITHILH